MTYLVTSHQDQHYQHQITQRTHYWWGENVRIAHSGSCGKIWEVRGVQKSSSRSMRTNDLERWSGTFCFIIIHILDWWWHEYLKMSVLRVSSLVVWSIDWDTCFVTPEWEMCCSIQIPSLDSSLGRVTLTSDTVSSKYLKIIVTIIREYSMLQTLMGPNITFLLIVILS